MSVEQNVFPRAMGNETEIGLMDNSGGEFHESDFLLAVATEDLPDGLTEVNTFLSNGYCLYVQGGLISHELDELDTDVNLECATPECATPTELTEYIRGGEFLVHRVIERALVDESLITDQPIIARMQRRVVDSRGSRKGCHDNFDISNNSFSDEAQHLLLEHLTTRSFVTGAGYVGKGGLKYSQKVGGIKHINYYGFAGSMFYVHSSPNNPERRLEVRCSDVNISDWATWQRVGNTALAIAVGQIPEVSKLLVPQVPQSEDRAILRVKQHNNLRLRQDGSIESSPEQIYALGFQKRLAEIVMDNLPEHTELPDEYFTVANELYKYCEDYQKVLEGDSPIDILADRADWATKFSLIQRRIRDDEGFGIKRDLADIETRAQDMYYDSLTITAEGHDVTVDEGYGFKARRKGVFRKNVSEIDALRAYKNAPQNTRAKLRVSLMSEYSNLKRCNWSDFIFSSDDGNTYTLNVPDALRTGIREDERVTLDTVQALHEKTSQRVKLK